MSAARARGFAEPVFDAQLVFRAVLAAMSRPGRPRALPLNVTPPAPLAPELAAIALALVDHEAPLWLDPALSAADEVGPFLRFHTGVPLVAAPDAAAYALVGDATRLPGLDRFAQGSQDYPDRSTTVLLGVERFGTGERISLSGPGIVGTSTFQADPLPAGFAAMLAANHGLFPRGVDILLAGDGQVLGLPRSSAVSGVA